MLLLPPGKPSNLLGLSIQPMPGMRYRLNNQSNLVTIDKVIQSVMDKVSQQKTVIEIPTHPLFPKEWVAMTTHFPFAWMMAKGYKAEEFRSKPTNYRGLVLLHAGGSKDSDFVIDQYKIPQNQITRKRILGVATITGCEQAGEDYIYILENPTCFPKPTSEIPGQLSIFWKASTPERVRAFNEAWLMLKGEM